MAKPFNRQSVIKEFLGRIVKSIGRKKGAAAAKQMMKSPEMKKLAKQSAELANDIEKQMKKDAEAGDTTAQDALNILKQMGY